MIRFQPQIIFRFGLGLTLLGSLLGGSSQLQAGEVGSLSLANKLLQTDQARRLNA